MTTHAHRKGEFPSKEKPKKAIEKDVAYHVHHAEKHAGLAREAHAAHTAATSASARAEAALRAAHANKKAQKHAAEAEKQAPGSYQALTARSHANEAKSRYELTQTKSPQEMQKKKATAEKAYQDHQNSAAAQTHGTVAHSKSFGQSTLTKVKAASKSEHHSDEHLAEVVHATIPHVPESGRFDSRKVFTHEVYEAMPAADKAKFGSLNDFKSKLRTLNQKALIQLARADLVSAMNPVQVQKSHVSLNSDEHFDKIGGGAHANFVIDQRAGVKIHSASHDGPGSSPVSSHPSSVEAHKASLAAMQSPSAKAHSHAAYLHGEAGYESGFSDEHDRLATFHRNESMKYPDDSAKLSKTSVSWAKGKKFL